MYINPWVRMFRAFFVSICSNLAVAVLAMLLWNWLVVSIFNGPRLNYLQTLGLMYLLRFLLS